MKKFLILLFVVALAMMSVSTAFAHTAPPCNDTDMDGSPSGYEYATHHIVPLAQAGNLGDGGHKPGAHEGFSLCNPSGN